jgi:DNA-binding transcriptional MerR regulator
VVRGLEEARPEDRARFFAQYQRRMRERVTRYMIERLGARLGFAPEEIESLKQQPEDQRAGRVLELRQRLTQAEARELGLPPGLTQEQWESWLRLPPQEFFERLAEHVRERQLAGADPGIGRGGARGGGAHGLPLARIRALRRLQEAAQIEPADLVELADEAPDVRRQRVEERTRQRCLAILDEGELASPEELERWRRMDAPAFAGALEELLAPLRAHWKRPESEKH